MIKINLVWNISKLPSLTNIQICFITFKVIASRTNVFIKYSTVTFGHSLQYLYLNQTWFCNIQRKHFVLLIETGESETLDGIISLKTLNMSDTCKLDKVAAVKWFTACLICHCYFEIVILVSD